MRLVEVRLMEVRLVMMMMVMGETSKLNAGTL